MPEIARTLPARDDLLGYLRGKQLLLLLDNFEHLLAAAPDLATLLATDDGLRVIVTSRAPLKISGEREYPLEPLPPEDAVTLFLERARGVGKDFAPDPTVEAICRSLDGLPLAIELAAARTKLPQPGGAPGAPRSRPGSAHGWRARRPRTSTNPPGDDRMEPRPPRPGLETSLRPSLGLSRELSARGRRGGLRRRPGRGGSARRPQPAEADRRGSFPDAGDDPRIRRGEARGFRRGRRAAWPPRKRIPVSGRRVLRASRGRGGRVLGAP